MQDTDICVDDPAHKPLLFSSVIKTVGIQESHSH